MKPYKFILTSLCIIASLFVFGQQEQIPQNYTSIEDILGDLDQDGIAEKVSVFNMTLHKDDDNGIDRELIIFKMQNGKWMIWKRSKEAVGNSKDGGMMGDPFEDINIKNGLLLVSQSGGSSWKWGHTDYYRFQHGEFELVGYHSNYGKLCEYWGEVDYNISTGKIIIKKEYERCNGDDQTIYKRENETFNYKLNVKILIQHRKTNKIEFVSPKYKHSIYL